MVLAYSGGLDTSIIIPWLRETYGCEVIAWPMWITLNGAQSVEVTSVMAIVSLGFTLCAYYSMVEVYAKSRGKGAAA